MAQENKAYFWRGLEANRKAQVPKMGEPLWTTDTKQLYVGDGVTAGGIAVYAVPTTSTKTADFTVSKDDGFDHIYRVTSHQAEVTIPPGLPEGFRFSVIFSPENTIVTTGYTEVVPANHSHFPSEDYAKISYLVCPGNILDISGMLKRRMSKPLIVEWKTTGANEVVTYPISGAIDCYIDWGDGSRLEYVNSEKPTHSYVTPGLHSIECIGEVYTWSTTNCPTGKNFLTKFKQWGDLKISNIINMFTESLLLTEYDPVDIGHLGNYGEKADGMFGKCDNLVKINFAKLNFLGVKTASYFCQAGKANKGIDGMRLTSLPDLSGLVYDLGDFKVENAALAFSGLGTVAGLGDIDFHKINLSDCVNMSKIYQNTGNTKIDLSKDVVGSKAPFGELTKVKDMSGAFSSNKHVTHIIFPGGRFKVLNMPELLSMASGFSGNPELVAIENFQIIKSYGCKDYSYAFAINPKLTDVDLSKMDVASCVTMIGMLQDTPLTTAHYDAFLINASKQNVQYGVRLAANLCKYTPGGAAEAARTLLTSATIRWVISDNGPV